MSPASLDTWIIGRLFSIPSVSTRAVLSNSLKTILCATIAFSLFFVHCISLSHAPSKCGALSGWKFHSISLGAQKFFILSSTNSLMHFCNSLFAPTKFVPLSLWMLCGRPRSANLLKPWWTDLLKNHPLRWYARVLMQVNKLPYALTSLRLLTNMAPKKSTTVFPGAPHLAQVCTLVDFLFAAPEALLSGDNSNYTWTSCSLPPDDHGCSNTPA